MRGEGAILARLVAALVEAIVATLERIQLSLVGERNTMGIYQTD